MHLKTVHLLFACMWFASACKPEYTYLIKADVQNCDGCQAELLFHNNSKTKTIETAYVKNGSFFMQGKTTLPGFYEVKLSDTVNHTRVDAQIYLPADTLLLTFNPEGLSGKPYRFPAVHSNLAFVKAVSTSPVQQTLNKYLALRDSMKQKHLTDYDLRVAIFRQAIDAEDKMMVKQWADTVNNFPYRSSSYKTRAADIILQQHPESEVAFFAMLDNINRRTVYRFRRFYQNLDSDRKESFYGRMLDYNLTQYEGPYHSAQQFVGRSMPALFGVTPTGGKLDGRISTAGTNSPWFSSGCPGATPVLISFRASGICTSVTTAKASM